MTPEQSAEALISFAGQCGCDLNGSTPAEGIDAMLRFFREMRPEGRLSEDVGDMLLYQWGIYRFSGSPSFQLNLTRQFIELVEEEREDEEVMSQLGLTFHFPPTDAMQALGAQNRWCESVEDVDDLLAFITRSVPYVTLKDQRATRVEIQWSLV
jgi:hypothetical protein